MSWHSTWPPGYTAMWSLQAAACSRRRREHHGLQFRHSWIQLQRCNSTQHQSTHSRLQVAPVDGGIVGLAKRAQLANQVIVVVETAHLR